MDYELIIFDCDGVLVDSEPLANAELQKALADCGLSLTQPEIVKHFVGISMQSVVTKAENMLGKPLPVDFLERLREKTFARFEEGLREVAGISQVLDILTHGEQRICVASSGNFDKLNFTLGLTGLRKYFEPHIFSAVQVRRGKPYPDLFLFAAREMEVDPSQCLVVEDSLPGVQAAVAAGMEVLAYSARGEDRALARAGGMVIRDMADIIEYLA